MPALIRPLFALSLALAVLPGLALAQDARPAAGPTMGEIARQAQQQQAAPVPASPLPPAGNLPTMGDLVRQQGQAAAAAQAEAPGCTRPRTPGALPDGTKATEEDMRKAQVAVKTYVTESEAFNTCLDRLVKSAQNQVTVEEYLALVQQYDLTVAAMQIFADRFNEQLRIYRARAKP
ncbi:hypothetical protein [Niveispirillum fermenti]|uniref:hypothetical protein n=1 Tax=Niveispirillum fermenti TaxID=1233113 RepID=UPI003A8950A1